MKQTKIIVYSDTYAQSVQRMKDALAYWIDNGVVDPMVRLQPVPTMEHEGCSIEFREAGNDARCSKRLER